MKGRADLVLDFADPARLVEYWRKALGYRGHFVDTFAVLAPKGHILQWGRMTDPEHNEFLRLHRRRAVIARATRDFLVFLSCAAVRRSSQG